MKKLKKVRKTRNDTIKAYSVSCQCNCGGNQTSHMAQVTFNRSRGL
jgi:putative bacteriocin precursor